MTSRSASLSLDLVPRFGAAPPLGRGLAGAVVAALTVVSGVAVAANFSLLGEYVPASFSESTLVWLPPTARPAPESPAAEPELPPPGGERELVVRPPAAVPIALEVAGTVRDANAMFDARDFDLEAVRAGAPVPRVFITAMPADVAAIPTVEGKRQFFYRALLPAILQVNEAIERDRKHLNYIASRQAQGLAVTEADQAWLAALAKRYKTKDGDVAELLRRVDVVPPSLAIAQAIIETGWGASAAARRLNALYGQIGGDGTSTARLASFANIQESVAAYVHNLNTHFAYGGFRDLRGRMRAEAAPIDAEKLAATLTRYSELGAVYTREVQGLIRRERLAEYDGARLAADARLTP
jgi:Bax protein